MKDRYLYKAKRVDTGEWVIGFYSVCTDNYTPKNVHSITTFKKLENGEIILTGMFYVDPSSICQCTGLKDKKDRLIWENDSCIITRTAICVSVRIIYKDACFWAKDELYDTLIRLCDLKVNGYEIEVVND